HMPMSTLSFLKNQYKNVDFISGSDLINEIKCVKHPQEIENLRYAANIAEEALFDVISQIGIGMSEYDIKQAYNFRVVSKGCNPYFCVITIDERAAFSDTEARKWSKIKS